MNTLQMLSQFFEKRKREQHYYNLKSLPSSISNDDKVNWILNSSGAKTLRLNIEIPYEDMYCEAFKLLSKFRSHRDENEEHRGWSSLVLHGRGEHITRADNQYADLASFPNHHWTKFADVCPVTTNWLKKSIPLDNYLRVRFMLLEPGGFILPHKDNNDNKLQSMNIALNNPDGCVFGMDGYGVIPWQPGDVRLVNISIDHAVWNNSNLPRIHMIVHGASERQKKEYSSLVIRSYNNAFEEYKKVTGRWSTSN